MANLGDSLNTLFDDIDGRKDLDTKISYSAKLIQGRPEKCAKKLGEEAIELGHALILQNRYEIISEAADVLYHFAALIVKSGVDPNEIADELERRRGTSGIEEKAKRGT